MIGIQKDTDGLEHLLAGRYKAAKSTYAKLVKDGQVDPRIDLEALCVLSAGNDVIRARENLRRYENVRLDPVCRARFLTACAYVAVHNGTPEAAVKLLHKAADLDPAFPLPPLSLGRHFLFSERDEESARQYLRMAARISPFSEGTLLGLVSLGAETGDYVGSRQASLTLIRRHPWRLRGWLSLVSASFLIQPFTGSLMILALMVTLFLPWVGPGLMLLWPAFAVLTFLRLRRTSPRLSLTPALVYLPLLVVYFVRWTLYGTWLP